MPQMPAVGIKTPHLIRKQTPNLRSSLNQMTNSLIWTPSTTKSSRQSANQRSLSPTGTPLTTKRTRGPHHPVVQAEKNSIDRGLVRLESWPPAPWCWCGTLAKPCRRVQSESDPSPWINWSIQSSLKISSRPPRQLIIRLEAAEVTWVHSTKDSASK